MLNKSQIGLQLHPQKTTISHTLHGEDAGFEFLGYQVRQYPVGKYAAKRRYKTVISPSKESLKRHWSHLKKLVRVNLGSTQKELIDSLNPVITGWCQYYRNVASYKAFATLSSQLFFELLRWAKHRHPNLNAHQTVSRYWLVNSGGGWIFTPRGGAKLRYHKHIRFHFHVKVQGKRSPYDGDWVYWGTRARYYPGLSPLKSYLLKQQEGKCRRCGLTFLPNESIEKYHLDGNHDNYQRDNLALMHSYCDQNRPALAKPSPVGTRDKEPSWRGAG